MDHTVKNLLAMQKTWVQSLGWDDQLVKEMTVHTSILAWEISWTEKPGGLQSPGVGDGNPHQYSCLENSMEREAWQAPVHGVTESDMIE